MGLKPLADEYEDPERWNPLMVIFFVAILICPLMALHLYDDYKNSRPVSKVFTVCSLQASPATGNSTYDLVATDSRAQAYLLRLESNSVTVTAMPGVVTGGTYKITFSKRDGWWLENAQVTSIKLAKEQRPQDCGLRLSGSDR